MNIATALLPQRVGANTQYFGGFVAYCDEKKENWAQKRECD